MARLDPVPPRQWPPEMTDALAALRPPDPRHPLPRREGRPKGRNLLGTLAHHPALARAYHVLTGHVLFATTLSERQRELVVLRVAALRRAEYEWRQHALLGADAGLGPDEQAAVCEGPGAPAWSPLEAAILSAVDELVAHATVSGPTWSVLAATLSPEQLMDLVFTVGTYDLLAMALGAFGVEPDQDLAAATPPPPFATGASTEEGAP